MELEKAAEQLGEVHSAYKQNRKKLKKFQDEIASLIKALEAEVERDFDSRQSSGSVDRPRFNLLEGIEEDFADLQSSRDRLIEIKNLFRGKGLTVNPIP